MSNKDFEEGLARRTQLLGEAYVTKAMHQAPAFNREIQEYLASDGIHPATPETAGSSRCAADAAWRAAT